jgi:CHAT domain-containing protein
MTKLLRSLTTSLCLGLITLTLAIAIPVIAQPSIPDPIVKVADKGLNLINQGRIAYEAGRYTEAVNAWQEAEKQYQHEGKGVLRVSNLNYLCLAYQKLGKWQEAEKYNTLSLELLQQRSLLPDEHLSLLGQALNGKGSLELATGKSQDALETWQQATATYEKAGDKTGVIGSQINQAQALQTLGLHRRAQKLLEQTQQQLNEQSDPLLQTKLLRSLGTTLQTIGDLQQSQKVLEASLAIAQKFNLPEEQAATLFSLGNTTKLQGNYQTAIAFYQQAADLTIEPITKVEAQLNLLSSLIITKQQETAQAILPNIQADLAKLSPSRPTIYAKVNLAKNLIDLQTKNTNSTKYTAEIESLLQETLKQARELQDLRAESSALGTLGYFYEQQQKWSTAQEITTKALNLSQTINADDISYQWQWQLGRLLQAQGDKQKAIAPYTEAVNNLQSLRSSLVAVNPDAQFSFRESVEPVYRELVGLLLDVNPNQKQLQQAREVIESLQLAELENFFQEACLDAQPRQIEEVDPSAAVIYPIILPDRLAVILSLPDHTLRHYSTYLPQAEIENTIANLHQSLNPIFSNQKRLQLSQQVYDWLIKPAEADLNHNGIKTVAFVLDGSLRGIPMAALFDGKEYAIAKYNIALTPGLQLLPSQGLQTEKLQAIIAGVSESNQGFASLPGVQKEVTQIAQQLSSQLLLNGEFTDSNLQKQLQQTAAPIVHLATHGQFGSTPEETFIVTWNNRIKVNELQNLLRTRETTQAKPIELMVLSACQTATGDDRAALGMAGMAVRSGARSTLATLWSVKDESTTQLINKFYQQLLHSRSGVNKAQALREAQLALINSPDFNHPFYWSAFVLVGNWL